MSDPTVWIDHDFEDIYGKIRICRFYENGIEISQSKNSISKGSIIIERKSFVRIIKALINYYIDTGGKEGKKS